MKHWEEAGLLTDLLDRHLQRLVEATEPNDWTIFWAIAPFLQLLRTEPVLAVLINDYVAEVSTACAARDSGVGKLLQGAEAVAAEHKQALAAVRELIEPSKRDGLGIDKLKEKIALARAHPHDLGHTESALDCLNVWIGFGYRSEEERWTHADLATASGAVGQLRNQLKRLRLQLDRFSASHPGEAYQRLLGHISRLNYAASSDLLADEVQNREVEKVRGYIRETETWGDALGGIAQPAIISVQRDVRTLHLALVTSLAKGRSRWATVRRFASRCESFDRERILSLLQNVQGARPRSGRPAKTTRSAEAILTMEFARYLFDAGFNPLVDTAACGLRPDVLDPASEPAVYVEAKQYEKVSDSVAARLKADIAQTLNTWGRLERRWNVPEAFLLVFRRSGRPLVLDDHEVRVGRRRLYVLAVDLADASESGSRAKAAVRIDVRALLPSTGTRKRSRGTT